MSAKKSLGVLDVLHRGLVLGLFGLTVFYTGMVGLRGNDIIQRYMAHKKSQTLNTEAASEASPAGTDAQLSGAAPAGADTAASSK